MMRNDNSHILFIINVKAGIGHQAGLLKAIQKLDEPVNYVLSGSVEEVREVFEQNLERYSVFVIAGGDGSVNEAIKYLVDQPGKLLAVYPLGSGNGFANELGFKRNLNSLLKDIKEGNTMDVDIIKINNTICINASGLGFDGYVAHAFQKTKNRGLANYIRLAVKAFLHFKPFYADISSADFKRQGKYMMITLANTRQFGNNAIIAPQAKPNDGAIEVVLVKPFPYFQLPIFVFKIFRGISVKSSFVEYLSTKKPLLIHSEYDGFHIDGDPISFKDEVKVSIEQGLISIIKTSNNRIASAGV